MRCTRCGGTLANVQGYRQCTECGTAHTESRGVPQQFDRDPTR